MPLSRKILPHGKAKVQAGIATGSSVSSLALDGNTLQLNQSNSQPQRTVDLSSLVSGDITGVTAGTNLNGGGNSGAVTLNLDTNITGDIAFDTNVLKIDASNDRVGIGTASPSEKLEVFPNTDVNAIIGRAVIGYNFSDYASFSHYDQRANTGGYALLQKDDGTTYLNAKSGMMINFREENSTKFITSCSHIEVYIVVTKVHIQ